VPKIKLALTDDTASHQSLVEVFPRIFSKYTPVGEDVVFRSPAFAMAARAWCKAMLFQKGTLILPFTRQLVFQRTQF
jgi:hypothetical protein